MVSPDPVDARLGVVGTVGKGVDEPSRVDGRSIACRIIEECCYESSGWNGSDDAEVVVDEQQNDRTRQS